MEWLSHVILLRDILHVEQGGLVRHLVTLLKVQLAALCVIQVVALDYICLALSVWFLEDPLVCGQALDSLRSPRINEFVPLTVFNVDLIHDFEVELGAVDKVLLFLDMITQGLCCHALGGLRLSFLHVVQALQVVVLDIELLVFDVLKVLHLRKGLLDLLGLHLSLGAGLLLGWQVLLVCLNEVLAYFGGVLHVAGGHRGLEVDVHWVCVLLVLG